MRAPRPPTRGCLAVANAFLLAALLTACWRRPRGRPPRRRPAIDVQAAGGDHGHSGAPVDHPVAGGVVDAKPQSRDHRHGVRRARSGHLSVVLGRRRSRHRGAEPSGRPSGTPPGRWNVSQRYTVIVDRAWDLPARPFTRTRVRFAHSRPRADGRGPDRRGIPPNTYGVGMPIVLYFSAPVAQQGGRGARASRSGPRDPFWGPWYWDSQCGMAPVCLYFRTRHYWPVAYSRELHRPPERGPGGSRGVRTPHAHPDVHDRDLL